MPGYTEKEAKAGLKAKLPRIETFANQFPGYEITDRDPRVHVRLPQDRPAGFRDADDRLRAQGRASWSSSP